jgi:hypothetical protein
MEKNIYANLNFADSLSDFQEDVTKLLDFQNIEEWSGIIVKEREEAIRQAALVLAGQCIGILLHKLFSVKRIERLTYKFGQIGINLRQTKISNLQQGKLPDGNILKDQRVVIAVDGGRSRIRINKKGRKNLKTNKHGFTGEWVEPKLLTIYVVDEQGNKVKNGEIKIVNDGTYEDYKGFLPILEMHLISLGISQAKQVLLIADGAEWIWKHIPLLLKKLKSPDATYQLFDFYHVTERLQKFADVAFSDDKERNNWFKKARRTLKKSNAMTIIRQMDEFIFEATGERCKTMVIQRNYLLRAYRERRLNYVKILDRKLPIGSGAIESLIRQVVNLRIKGNSKFWLKENAEIILHLRCQWMAGSWDNFCGSIFNSFIKPQTA